MNGWMGSPVSDGKTHGVADEDHGHYGFAAQLLVGIDAVADGKLGPNGVDEPEEAQGENQAEPLYVMRSSDTPQDQARGNERD